jgi:hypothetical protein
MDVVIIDAIIVAGTAAADTTTTRTPTWIKSPRGKK